MPGLGKGAGKVAKNLLELSVYAEVTIFRAAVAEDRFEKPAALLASWRRPERKNTFTNW